MTELEAPARRTAHRFVDLPTKDPVERRRYMVTNPIVMDSDDPPDLVAERLWHMVWASLATEGLPARTVRRSR